MQVALRRSAAAGVAFGVAGRIVQGGVVQGRDTCSVQHIGHHLPYRAHVQRRIACAGGKIRVKIQFGTGLVGFGGVGVQNQNLRFGAADVHCERQVGGVHGGQQVGVRVLGHVADGACRQLDGARIGGKILAADRPRVRRQCGCGGGSGRRAGCGRNRCRGGSRARGRDRGRRGGRLWGFGSGRHGGGQKKLPRNFALRQLQKRRKARRRAQQKQDRLPHSDPSKVFFGHGCTPFDHNFMILHRKLELFFKKALQVGVKRGKITCTVMGNQGGGTNA